MQRRLTTDQHFTLLRKPGLRIGLLLKKCQRRELPGKDPDRMNGHDHHRAKRGSRPHNCSGCRWPPPTIPPRHHAPGFCRQAGPFGDIKKRERTTVLVVQVGHKHHQLLHFLRQKRTTRLDNAEVCFNSVPMRS